MGWVSCLEDIVERFNSNLSSIRNATSSIDMDRHEGNLQQKFELDRLLRSSESLLNELMELATDPEIVLADEVRRLSEEKRTLEKTIQKCRDVIKELRDAYDRASTVLNEKNKLIKDLKEELAILQDPNSFYDSSFDSN